MCGHAPPSHEENAAVHVKKLFVNVKGGGEKRHLSFQKAQDLERKQQSMSLFLIHIFFYFENIC